MTSCISYSFQKILNSGFQVFHFQVPHRGEPPGWQSQASSVQTHISSPSQAMGFPHLGQGGGTNSFNFQGWNHLFVQGSNSRQSFRCQIFTGGARNFKGFPRRLNVQGVRVQPLFTEQAFLPPF